MTTSSSQVAFTTLFASKQKANFSTQSHLLNTTQNKGVTIFDTKNTDYSCFLSSLKALNNCKEGRMAISKAIEITKQGQIVVHTTIGEYKISSLQFKSAKMTNAFSTSSNKIMVAMLAIKEILSDYTEGRIELPYTLFVHKTRKRNTKYSSELYDNASNIVFYLFTGKETFTNTDYFLKDYITGIFEKDNKISMALSYSVQFDKIITDIEGSLVKLSSLDSYAITDIEGDTITIIGNSEHKFKKTELLNSACELTYIKF